MALSDSLAGFKGDVEHYTASDDYGPHMAEAARAVADAADKLREQLDRFPGARIPRAVVRADLIGAGERVLEAFRALAMNAK